MILHRNLSRTSCHLPPQSFPIDCFLQVEPRPLHNEKEATLQHAAPAATGLPPLHTGGRGNCFPRRIVHHSPLGANESEDTTGPNRFSNETVLYVPF